MTDPASIALKVVSALRDERFAEVEALFAEPLRAVASADTLQTAWAAEISKSGPVTSLGDSALEKMAQGFVRASIVVTQEHGEFTVNMSIDDAGALQGLRFVPVVSAEWAPPAYAKPSKFTEEDVTLAAGSLSVEGTLSLPKKSAPLPAVILLSGGGPFDRDETHGINKPLKDIAWGLASRGIVVLRFDKVTQTHSEVANSPDFTMTEEYVPHAVAGIHMLQNHAAVDPARVFVLGHSMGGKVAPRVGAAEPSIAGLVLLAADAVPMQQAAVRVGNYLAEIDPSDANKRAAETIARQAAAVDDAGLSVSTPASALPFGFSAQYWLDMRSYDPVATAASLDKPMFIAQGGRDYQVTAKDDFSKWKAGLSAQPDKTFHLYEPDNHLFFPGEGKSAPAEYDPPQHVDAHVIADVAEWLSPQRGIVALVRKLLRV